LKFLFILSEKPEITATSLATAGKGSQMQGCMTRGLVTVERRLNHLP
jgi:hypothetical protein